MNKIGIVIVIAVLILTGGAVYWYRQNSHSMVEPRQEEVVAVPTVSQSDAYEDIQKDLDGTQLVVEDSEYSIVTTDINGL